MQTRPPWPALLQSGESRPSWRAWRCGSSRGARPVGKPRHRPARRRQPSSAASRPRGGCAQASGQRVCFSGPDLGALDVLSGSEVSESSELDQTCCCGCGCGCGCGLQLSSLSLGYCCPCPPGPTSSSSARSSSVPTSSSSSSVNCVCSSSLYTGAGALPDALSIWRTARRIARRIPRCLHLAASWSAPAPGAHSSAAAARSAATSAAGSCRQRTAEEATTRRGSRGAAAGSRLPKQSPGPWTWGRPNRSAAF